MEMDLLRQIESSYHSFSKGQKCIANYVMNNYDKAVNLTAAKLGRIVGVSESTVVRFATELGFKGYPGFQKALDEIVKNKLNSIQRIALTTTRLEEDKVLDMVLQSDYENLRFTKEQMNNEDFDRAIDLISDARKIYIVGGRSCEALAQFMGYYLNYIFDNVKLISSNSVTVSLEEIHRMNSEDVIIGVSFPRYSIDTVRVIEFSQKRNAKIITITDSNASPMIKYSDCKLFAKSDMVSVVDSLVAPLSLINALIAALSIRNKDRVVASMETLEDIWEEFSVYKDADSDSRGQP